MEKKIRNKNARSRASARLFINIFGGAQAQLQTKKFMLVVGLQPDYL